MRQQQHYDLSLNREYPLDDSASLIADDGRRLPEGLFTDASFVIDKRISNRVFVASVTKKGSFCSVVIAANTVEKQAVALASISLDSFDTSLPLGQSPQVPVQPLTAGFQGSICFGEQWSRIEDGSWLFSNPLNSIFAARCCFPISLPGTQTIGVTYSQQLLQGLVELRDEGDIQLSIEDRVLGGATRRAVVIALRRTSSEVLQDYAGSQLRPESRSCGDPQPIETINGVAADCCGRVYLEFRGCATPVAIGNHCGVVLDCPLTLADICPPPKNFAEEDNPDQCLSEGVENPLLPSDDRPTLPPVY